MADFGVDVDDDGYLWTCQIRPVWNGLTISLLVRLIFVVGVLGAVSISWFSLPSAADDRVPFLVSLLIPGLVMAYLAWTTVRLVLWMRDGERMVMCAGVIALEKQPARGETVTFVVTELRDLQVRLVRPKRTLIRGCLRFGTENGTYTFGRGLSPRQSEELYAAVRTQLRKAGWTGETLPPQ